MYVSQKLQREKGMVQGVAQCIQQVSNSQNFRGKSTREISPTARKLVKVNEYKIHPGMYFYLDIFATHTMELLHKPYRNSSR